MCRHHSFLWISLPPPPSPPLSHFIRPYQWSPLVSPLNNINRAAEYRFLLVYQNWWVYVYESIGESRSWVRCFFTTSSEYLLIFLHGWFVWCDSLPTRLGLLNTPTAPLQRGKIPPNVCSIYDTKESDGEVLVRLDVFRMQRTLSSSLLPGPFWSGLVAPDRALSMG